MRIMLLVACVMISAVSVSAKDKKTESKIAVVNMAKLIKAFPGTEASEAVLKDYIEEFEADKDAMMKDLTEKQDELQKLANESEDDAFSEKVLKEKKKEFLEMMEAFRAHRQGIMDKLKMKQMEITDEKKRLQKRIFEDIQKVVSEHAKKEGYTMVIDTSALIYSSENVEITQDILKIVEKQK